MLSLNTNLAALMAQSSDRAAARDVARAMQELTTGQRINSAAADAAGLAITTRLTSQIIGVNAALRNANDGVSLVQTADAAAGDMVSAFQRMRELRVQYENGANNTADKVSILREIKSLKAQISETATGATWNGMKLFDGAGGTGSRQFNLNVGGSDAAQSQITVSIPNLFQTIGIDAHSDAVSFAAPISTSVHFVEHKSLHGLGG